MQYAPEEAKFVKLPENMSANNRTKITRIHKTQFRISSLKTSTIQILLRLLMTNTRMHLQNFV